MQIIVLTTTILYFLIGFVIPSYLVWKRTGVNPVTFSKNDNAHDFVGQAFKVIMLFLFIDIATYALIPQWYKYFKSFNTLEEIGVLKILGLTLVIISLGIVSLAQVKMSNSWRIGIDESNKTKLVTTGIFSKSRNPVFLGMQISLLGLFLITPNALMMLVLVMGSFCMHIQVRMEEEFLLRTQPEYKSYAAQVRRWI